MKLILALTLILALIVGVMPAWAAHNPIHLLSSSEFFYGAIGSAMTVVAFASGSAVALLVPVAVWYGYYKCFVEKSCAALDNPYPVIPAIPESP